jgi:hypothetical protein
VQHDHRVVVHVDDVGLGRGLLRDLMGVVRRRQPGPDVEELPDALLAGQVLDRTGQERAVGADRRDGGGKASRPAAAAARSAG